jgi:hypothetical protein
MSGKSLKASSVTRYVAQLKDVASMPAERDAAERAEAALATVALLGSYIQQSRTRKRRALLQPPRHLPTMLGLR